MKHAEQEPVIRIVKKKPAHHGHHGGAWKVAYADFVTAMMALFIVLWIVGQSKQIKQYVAQYFRDPGALFENTRGGGLLMGTALQTNEPSMDEFLKREREKLKEMAEAITEQIGRQPGLAKMLDQIKMEIVREGLRIELLEKSESFFFDIGTATLKPEAVKILETIAKEVARLPNHVIVEGHTDARPYPRKDGYTNFELSADRANSARRVLIKGGLPAERLDEVRGYADRKLRNPDDPLDLTNRRVSIIIRFKESERD